MEKRKYGPCWQLPITFDAAQILADVQAVAHGLWDTEQSRAAQDEASRLFLKGYPVRLAKPSDDRRAMLEYPALARLVRDQLPGVVQSCLVAVLPGGAIIHPHRDYVGVHPHYSNTYRIHVPLKTHPGVDFFLGRSVFHMELGNCYLIDNGQWHAVKNRHPTEDRLHVVADVVPDEPFLDLLARATALPGLPITGEDLEWYDKKVDAPAPYVG